MTDDTKKFCQYFDAMIEETDKLVYRQNIGHSPNIHVSTAKTVQVGTSVSDTDVEPLVTIYLPESQAKRLITDVMADLRDKELTFNDPRIYEEWIRYKTMLELLR